MEQTKRTPFIMVFFLGLLTAMAPLLMDLYMPAMPSLPAIFGVNASTIQLSLTMTMVGMAVGQIIIGPLSDMYGRKWPLFIGMALSALSSLICATATTIEALLIGRLIQGLASSAGLVIAKAIARDLTEGAELNQLLAALMMVNGFAPIIGPLIGGFILSLGDWHDVFFVLTTACALLAIGTLAFKESLKKEHRLVGGFKVTLKAFGKLVKDSYFASHCLVQWFAFGAFFCYISGSSFLFQNVYGLSPQGYSYAFGFLSLSFLIASYITRKIANNVSPNTILKYALLIALLGSSLFLLALVFHAPLWLIIAILFPTIATVSPMGSSSFSLALASYGAMAGSASALLGFFSQASAGIVAPLVGIAGDHNAFPMAIIMVLGNILAVITFYWKVNNREPKKVEA